MDYVILRPSIVYGAGAQFAEMWVRRALHKGPRPSGARALVDASQMVHVRDLVSALILAMVRDDAANGTFNIAGGETAPLAALDALIRSSARRLHAGLPPIVNGTTARWDLAQFAMTWPTPRRGLGSAPRSLCAKDWRR